MSFKGASNSGVSGAGFKAGFTTQKTAIKTAKLGATTKTSSTNNDSQTNDAEVSKSADTQGAQTFATSRPGQAGSDARKASQNGKSRAQAIMDAAKYNKLKGGGDPGSAYNNINNFRQNANDAAAFQAMIKGSQATAKALADGIAKAFAGAGDLIGGLVKQAQKKAQSSGGGQQSSGGGGGQESSQVAQQEQQQSAEDMVAFDQADQGGGEVA